MSAPVTAAEREALAALGYTWLDAHDTPRKVLAAYRAGYKNGLRDGEVSMCIAPEGGAR